MSKPTESPNAKPLVQISQISPPLWDTSTTFGLASDTDIDLTMPKDMEDSETLTLTSTTDAAVFSNFVKKGQLDEAYIQCLNLQYVSLSNLLRAWNELNELNAQNKLIGKPDDNSQLFQNIIFNTMALSPDRISFIQDGRLSETLFKDPWSFVFLDQQPLFVEHVKSLPKNERVLRNRQRRALYNTVVPDGQKFTFYSSDDGPVPFTVHRQFVPPNIERGRNKFNAPLKKSHLTKYVKYLYTKNCNGFPEDALAALSSFASTYMDIDLLQCLELERLSPGQNDPDASTMDLILYAIEDEIVEKRVVVNHIQWWIHQNPTPAYTDIESTFSVKSVPELNTLDEFKAHSGVIDIVPSLLRYLIKDKEYRELIGQNARCAHLHSVFVQNRLDKTTPVDRLLGVLSLSIFTDRVTRECVRSEMLSMFVDMDRNGTLIDTIEEARLIDKQHIQYIKKLAQEWGFDIISPADRHIRTAGPQ